MCVIGKVGSGKSSLLACILGDVQFISGGMNIDINIKQLGIGYVSQESWIQQKSIKDNILFGKAMNFLKYRKVLEVCALLEDLETFPNGDETEVGEKGATLSGGQKARIALARAVYQDFDIYLLDDPLSAVDTHVAEFIFTNCIMGILKDKTRILCTHKAHLTKSADYLVILSNGKVVSQGPPHHALQFYTLNTAAEDDFVSEQSIETVNGVSKEKSVLVQKENKKKGVVKMHVYKSYWMAIGTMFSLAILLFCFLMQGSKTVSDWWLSYWISSVTQKNSTVSSPVEIYNHQYIASAKSLTFYLGVYGGIAAANSIFTFVRAFLFAAAGIKAAVGLHERVLDTIMRATSSFFDSTPLGRIMNRFSSDVYCIDDSLPFMLNILLAQLFSLLGCIIITCYGLPWILVFIGLLSIVYFRLQAYYRFTSRELKRLSSISLSPIYVHFSETLHGQSTIRAMAVSARFQRENMEYIDCNLKACLATAAASQWLNLRLQFIGVIIVTAVAVLALIERLFSDVNPGLVGLALSYALSVTSLLNGSITSFTETEKEIVSVERVMEYIEGVTTERSDYKQLPPFAWPSHGVITFTNVGLKYRPSCPYSLQNVSFETKPGEKIGVVGRTGSGKSSLIQVLCRMVDSYEGKVSIDGTDISNLKLKKLRSNITVIPQDPFLFSGTLRDNIDPCNLSSDSQIWQALRSCHIEEKIYNMGGLGAEVDECGKNFSIGEKQLICLARALLRKTKILCMDEVTANIDYETDSLIRHMIRLAFRRSTILVIAHRIETILDCDRVIVMKEGEIFEMDKPSILLANESSEFYKLVYCKDS